MHVHVKWGKELYKDIEVNLEETPLLFKSQLFTLTGVLPERQKVIVKSAVLNDESWDGVRVKEGQTILLMGSADAPSSSAAVPSQPTVFMEDLPVDEQDPYDMSQYGAGLRNLGNTCYMNSSLQLLYAVPELRENLMSYQPAEMGSDLSNTLTSTAGSLFREMVKSSSSVMPVRFLLMLRNKYPQFGEMSSEGGYKQQDAEECFSQIVHIFNDRLKVDPTNNGSPSTIQQLFAINFKTVLTCKETGETISLAQTEVKIKCNIPQNPPIHHVYEGIKEGLKADRMQNSNASGESVLFEGSSEITQLSSYFVLHLIRFSYRRDTQKRAKILRKVTFPAVVDLYEFCSGEYKTTLDKGRARMEQLREEEIAKRGENAPSEVAESAEEDAIAMQKVLTGRYELIGALTHKGRSANSGHYVSWIKQADNQWIEFDDDNLIIRKEEEILELSGGGDWHMAYLLLYKAQTVDIPEQTTAITEDVTVAE